MGDQLLPPHERVAGILAGAVEQLAEIQVEVAQEGVHAVGVGDRDPEVAAVFLGPHLEGEGLRVPEARAERLAGLHVFVRDGPQRGQVVSHCEPDVRGPGEELRDLVLQRADDLLVPGQREAAARTVVGDLELVRGVESAQRGDLLLQAAAPLVNVNLRLRVPEIHLAHDREDGNFIEDRVQPRPVDGDVDLARQLRIGLDPHVLAVEGEQAEEVDEIRLHEAQ